MLIRLFMIISGTVLFLIGIIGTRKAEDLRENANNQETTLYKVTGNLSLFSIGIGMGYLLYSTNSDNTVLSIIILAISAILTSIGIKLLPLLSDEYLKDRTSGMARLELHEKYDKKLILSICFLFAGMGIFCNCISIAEAIYSKL